MELRTLESWFPGETSSRANRLLDLSEKMKRVLPNGVEIVPVSYHDIECMWLTFKREDELTHIVMEACFDILDGHLDINVYFGKE